MNLKGSRFQFHIRKKILHCKGGEALEHVELVLVPSLEIFKAGESSEQPDLAEDGPAHCREVGLHNISEVPSGPSYSMIIFAPAMITAVLLGPVEKIGFVNL